MISQMPPPQMAGDELEPRKFLEHAVHDQARQRQAGVERAADTRGQPKFPHPLLAEADRRRMHEDRDVELARQREEGPCVGVVRIGATMARRDQHAAQAVLLHRALELLEMPITAARDRGRDRDQLVFVPVAQRRHVFVRRTDHRQCLRAVEALEIMAGVRDHADVETDLLVQTQHVLDGGRTVALPERQRLLAGRMDVGMPVDDHVACRRDEGCVRPDTIDQNP